MQNVSSLEYRQNFITIVTGAQGVGKTYRTLQEMKVYTCNDARIGRKGKPALIFDVNNEFSDKGIETIKYDVSNPKDNGLYIGQFRRPELRRVSPQKPNGKWMELHEKKKTFIDICEQFRNGCVLFEDLNAYVVETKNEEITSTLINVRHRGIDVFMHVQSLAAVTTTMFRNARYIRFHYQADDIQRYRNRITCFEMVKIAQLIVNHEYHSGNKRFFVYLDQYDLKIRGCSVEQYKQGLQSYMSQYGVSDTILANPSIYLGTN